MERWHEPMLLKSAKEMPIDDKRVYEPKWDGHRVIVVKTEERTRIYSRTGSQLLGHWIIPTITRVSEALGEHTAVVDGELVGIIEGQHNNNTVKVRDVRKKLAIVAFDITVYDGSELFNEPWTERREILENALPAEGRVMPTPYDYDGEAMEEAARSQGFEGFVAKLIQSRYRPGYRGMDWLKQKF